MTDMVRHERAQHTKTLQDVSFPELKYWNYAPCEHHDSPQPDCIYRACGGPFFRHQRLGITWLYLVERGLLADNVGMGKTNHILGLLALLKERERPYRTLVVAQPSAVKQWVAEANRFVPDLRAVVGEGKKNERYDIYDDDWELLVINNAILWRDRDYLAEAVPFDVLVADDIDPLRNSTRTATSFYTLSQKVEKCFVLNATPLQMRLEDLYRTSEPLGGRTIFGSLTYFQTKYIQRHSVVVPVRQPKGVRFCSCPKPSTKKTCATCGGRKKERTRTVWQTTGYKNIDEFKQKFGPIFLRRTYSDLEGDVSVPEIAPPNDIWLDLHPAQRQRYEELQQGVMTILKDHGTEINRVSALTAFLRGSQICAGLTALGEPDGPEASVKLDWIVNQMIGDWSDEKVVVFSKFRGTIDALRDRLSGNRIAVASIHGGVEAKARALEIKRFWEDPACRVAVGTSAIERSLNLQNSRIVVNIDQILNPARMGQILGRIRRVGSRHSHVFVFNLLTRDTQEEQYPQMLATRAALPNVVWEESNQLFEQLPPADLLRLIRP